MSKYPQFSLAFNIASNDERIEAFEFYQKTFNAKKLSESVPSDGPDIHIMMEINGFEILLAPGEFQMSQNPVVTCQLDFDNETELRKAYDILIQEGQNYSIGSYPWAKVGALVTDKYGVQWWLTI